MDNDRYSLTNGFCKNCNIPSILPFCSDLCRAKWERERKNIDLGWGFCPTQKDYRIRTARTAYNKYIEERYKWKRNSR